MNLALKKIMIVKQSKKSEQVLVIREDFIDKEIPKEKKAFSDESGNNYFKIIKKGFLNSVVEIKIFCECDHRIEVKIDIKNIPIDYLLYGSKFKRYRHKFICRSCERLFFIPVKLNFLNTKNPQMTVQEHYKEIKMIKNPQKDSSQILKRTDNQHKIEGFQKLIKLNEQRRVCLLSRRYGEITTEYEEIKKSIIDRLCLEYLKEMQDIDKKLITFLKNISKINHDELLKISKYEHNSIRKQLIKRDWDIRRYKNYKKKLFNEISRTIDLLKNYKFKLSLKYLNLSRKSSEILSGFPIFTKVQDILTNINNFSVEFIKFRLSDDIFKCFISMDSLFSKNKYNNACSEYDEFIHKANKSVYYRQVRDKVEVLDELHTEILNEYYYFCIKMGEYHYKNKDRKAIIYYQTAKNLVKHLFTKRGPVVAQLLRYISECEQFY